MIKTNSPEPDRNGNSLGTVPDFSLMTGGPFYQLLLRFNLLDDKSMLVGKAFIVVFPLLLWLPLLVLSAVGGQMSGGNVAVPFVHDLEVHVRLLVALPLLLAAAGLAEQRMRPVIAQFRERDLIPESALPQFEKALGSAARLRNSLVPELILIAAVYVIGIWAIWGNFIALDVPTWYAVPAAMGQDTQLSLAGKWYAFVSLPAFQFILCRWYFRLVIWARFLWQMSRIPMTLIPTHPDRAGGLDFLAEVNRPMTIFAFAHGALLAGWLSPRVVQLRIPLTDFKLEIAAMVAFVLIITISPLLALSTALRRTRREGLREFGTLATSYVRAFEAKYGRNEPGANPPILDIQSFLGTPDIQSLADLGNSYDLVMRMKKILVSKELIFHFVVATLLPVTPLLLTMMSITDLAKRLAGMLF